MKIPLKVLDFRSRGHVVGCGVQGHDGLALDLSASKGGKWSINWSLAGNLTDPEFASLLSRRTGGRHFWVSPNEEGGLQVETARAIEIPGGNLIKRSEQEDFFVTQIRSSFVNETIVFGGLRMRGTEIQNGVAAKSLIHNVGAGAIRDNVKRDYLNWYSRMGIRRPHIASTAMALANAYLALYPEAKRRATPLRLVLLKGRSVYRGILMDDWKYLDEVLLPRMEGDDATMEVIAGRMNGWIDYFRRQHPELGEDREIVPLVIATREDHVSDYEHWDLWGEYAMEKIDMSGEVAQAILKNRDLAPIAFGMALQGGAEMAYQIDFTASNYVYRSRRKTGLRLLLLSAIAAFSWGVYDCYVIYKQPTLDMRLSDYEAAAYPVEEMNAMWNQVEKEYGALSRYYRLIWAMNPTNFLSAAISADAPRLSHGFYPVAWTLRTGGECQLDYRFKFDPGDKAAQTKGLESQISNLVVAAVEVVDGKVGIEGVMHENLLNMDELEVSIRFSLADAKPFPTNVAMLAQCVKDIADMRERVQKTMVEDRSGLKSATPKQLIGVMTTYIPAGRDKPGYPDMRNVINVAGWFDRAEQFIAHNRIPGDKAGRLRQREAWDKLGKARFPWERYRILDNDELVNRTLALVRVSDGVRNFKSFLEKRKSDNQKKIEPFIDAYGHDDVYNKPIVNADLEGRVARAAGLRRIRVSFADEKSAEPAILEQDGERFTFSWVRWAIALGAAIERDDRREPTAAETETITLEQVADCVQRLMHLGPGYALETVKLTFDVRRNISGAVLEGLLPVKKVEQIVKKN